MADEDKSSKKHPASAKKKKDAKKKGNVAKSQDVGIASGLLAAFIALTAMKGFYMKQLLLTFDFSRNAIVDPANVDIMQLCLFTARQVAVLSLPVLCSVMIIAVAQNIAQVGFILTAEQMKPKLEKINPMKGIKKWFAIKSLVELMKSLAKIAVTFYIGYTVWRGFQDSINASVLLKADALLALGGKIISTLFWKVLILYITIAVIDALFQRWQWARDLKMSDKEIRDEYKNQEGDPYMKAKRKQIHQQIANQQSQENVPYADTVVINPTELAIALKYDPAVSQIPYVVAKGEQRHADKIRESARNSGVPIIRNKPLARSLYEMCEVGETIPTDLYRPVAEVLAYVFAVRDGQEAQDAHGPDGIHQPLLTGGVNG
jgi:flagellar biosynthetic protein FlhB